MSSISPDDDLERLAREQILLETKIALVRSKEVGPQGWKKCPLPRTNKRFLQNALLGTLTTKPSSSNNVDNKHDNGSSTVVKRQQEQQPYNSKCECRDKPTGHDDRACRLIQSSENDRRLPSNASADYHTRNKPQRRMTSRHSERKSSKPYKHAGTKRHERKTPDT